MMKSALSRGMKYSRQAKYFFPSPEKYRFHGFLLNRFQESDGCVNSIDPICGKLSGLEVKSVGLRNLRRHFQAVTVDAAFIALSRAAGCENPDMDQIRSLALGINPAASLNLPEPARALVSLLVWEKNGFVRAAFGAFPLGKQAGVCSSAKFIPPRRLGGTLWVFGAL
jgi:hypothetical protein